MRHLTYTGVYAGQLLCGKRRSELAESDGTVHFAYAPDSLVNDSDTCELCRHVAFCEDDDCGVCKVHAVVYPNQFSGGV